MLTITAIIPVYNRKENLKKVLISLNYQSRIVDEVIISDDGSQEDIPAAVREVLPELKFKVKYIRQEDKGFRAGKCRNNAIRESGGDYLLFIDQDIIATENYVKTFFKKKQADTFLVAYPVHLTETQSSQMSFEKIRNMKFENLLTPPQVRKIHKQFLKDGYEYVIKRIFRTRSYKPKLRSGVFGVYREQIIKVNGFDENYQGWGNEDDDLGRRLYKAGLIGHNPFYSEFPLHLFHPVNVTGRERTNLEYYARRKQEIKKGSIKAVNGIENPIGAEKIEVIALN
ncbi:MAG: glycosyltransferase [Calditrichia bacterium]